jgi:8-oxo-dGTP pyrophosphatase MutT (NUDIX family)
MRWDPDPRCIMTERSRTLRLHAGEVSFPGGRPEPEDQDLFGTAAREAVEETGLHVFRRLGELSNVPLYTSDYRLFPFVAEVQSPGQVVDPGEVASILEIPIMEMLHRPSFHAIPSHYQERDVLCPTFEWDGLVIFGGTAFVLLELLEICAKLSGLPMPPLLAGKYQWSDLLGPRT